MKSVRVLLADDHNLVRAGIKSLLEDSKSILVVGEAANGRDALLLTGQLLPDIVFLDIAMPELNGLDAAIRIKKEYPNIKTVILSMHTDEEYVIQALRSGAHGYILKDSAPGELKKTVETIMNGEIYISPSISPNVINEYMNRQKKNHQPDEVEFNREVLTQRQKEVLQLIAEGNSTKEIASKLFVSIKTVETHRAHIMEKLEIYDIAGLVKYAIKVGIIFTEK